MLLTFKGLYIKNHILKYSCMRCEIKVRINLMKTTFQWCQMVYNARVPIRLAIEVCSNYNNYA